jgi:hypothetical protein
MIRTSISGSSTLFTDDHIEWGWCVSSIGFFISASACAISKTILINQENFFGKQIFYSCRVAATRSKYDGIRS